MFRDYKALVEKQTGKQIKTFRSNDGEEFTYSDFIDFCKEAGIRKETNVPYNPEQNGVAKRKNRTIIEAVKVMLHDQKLPKFLWGEVANTIVYVQNISPHRALNNKTPKEVLTSEKPEVGHLRIIGYLVYFHVPKEKNNKLEALGKKGMFVGYCENSKAYRMYALGERNIELRRDVTFDEDAALGKARDTPPPPANVDSKDDVFEVEEDLEAKTDLVDEPMEPMDPPPCDPPSNKRRPLWLRDTLQDVDKHVAPRGTFREQETLPVPRICCNHEQHYSS